METKLTRIEQRYLRGLLKIRSMPPGFLRTINSFYRIWLFLTALIVGVILCFNALAIPREVSWLFAGFGLGAIIRDIGWLQTSYRVRKVMLSVINWEIVDAQLEKLNNSKLN